MDVRNSFSPREWVRHPTAGYWCLVPSLDKAFSIRSLRRFARSLPIRSPEVSDHEGTTPEEWMYWLEYSQHREYGFYREDDHSTPTPRPTRISLDVSAVAIASRRQKNRLAAIHGLPAELLSKIFWHALRDGRVWMDEIPLDYFERMQVLAQVSIIWAENIKRSPQLWAIADAKHTPYHWKTALTLSRSHPLTFKKGSFLDDRGSHFWDAFTQHIHRWASADATLYPTDDFTALSSQSAPLLERLRLSSSLPLFGHSRGNPVIDLFQGDAPKLQEFTLASCSLLHWNSAFLFGLRILSIKDVPVLGPSLQEMTDVLRASPDLEVLILEAINFRTDTTSSNYMTLMNLPKLTCLKLRKLSPHVIDCICSLIKAPVCLDFDLHPTRPDAPLFSTLKKLLAPYVTSHIKRCRVDHDHVTLHFQRSNDIVLSVETLPPRKSELSIAFGSTVGANPSEVVAWFLCLVDHPGTPPLPFVTLHFTTFNHLALAGTISLIGRLPTIRSLYFHECDQGIDELLNALATPSISRDGLFEWLCSQLQSLSLQDCDYSTPEIILQMVQVRKKALDARRGAGGPRKSSIPVQGVALGADPSTSMGKTAEEVPRRIIRAAEASSDGAPSSATPAPSSPTLPSTTQVLGLARVETRNEPALLRNIRVGGTSLMDVDTLDKLNTVIGPGRFGPAVEWIDRRASPRGA